MRNRAPIEFMNCNPPAKAFFSINGLRWALVLLSIGLPFLSGCQIMRGFSAKATPAPVVFNAMPSQAELIARINDHASRVNQLQSNITIELPGAPRLSGTLAIERPNRMRLKAGVGGITELGVDVGSNSELFWIWNKAAIPGQPPPAIYYARQNDYHRLQDRIDLPIDPQWIIDASGLVEFHPGDSHQGPYTDETGLLKLNTIRWTPNGRVLRVMWIDPKSALVYQQALYDANNQRIAWAKSSQFNYFPEQQVSLPQRIDLYVRTPQGDDMQMVISAGKYRVNAFYGNPDQTWSMPTPDGVPLINLAE